MRYDKRDVPGGQLAALERDIEDISSGLAACTMSNRARLDAVLKLKAVQRALDGLSAKEISGRDDAKRRLEDEAALMRQRLSVPMHNTVRVEYVGAPVSGGESVDGSGSANPLVVPQGATTVTHRVRRGAPNGCVIGHANPHAKRVACAAAGPARVQIQTARDAPAATAAYTRRIKGFRDLHSFLEQNHFGAHPLLQHPSHMLDLVVLPGDTPAPTESIVISRYDEAVAASAACENSSPRDPPPAQLQPPSPPAQQRATAASSDSQGRAHAAPIPAEDVTTEASQTAAPAVDAGAARSEQPQAPTAGDDARVRAAPAEEAPAPAVPAVGPVVGRDGGEGDAVATDVGDDSTPAERQPKPSPAETASKRLAVKTKVEIMTYVVLAVVFATPLCALWCWLSAYVLPA